MAAAAQFALNNAACLCQSFRQSFSQSTSPSGNLAVIQSPSHSVSQSVGVTQLQKAKK